MAPEQALGQTLDQRADLFSLGSVLYQMVAGRPPFRATTAVAVLKRVAEDKPRSIREIIPETPQWLCDIIAKLHAKDPADRYQSAREVADVLADCEAQLKANAKLKDFSRIPRPRSTPAGKWKWAAAAIVLLSIIALAATELAGLTHLFRGQQATRDPISTSGGPTPTSAGSPEVPRKAAEVLPFLVGTWQLDVEELDSKVAPGKGVTVGHLTYDYVAGGKVLRARGSSDSGKESVVYLHAYEPGQDRLRLWLAESAGFPSGPLTGVFNRDGHTLTWTYRDDASTTANHHFVFAGPDKITMHLYHVDDRNNVVRLRNQTLTRVKEPVAIPNLPIDAKRPDEMKVLDRLVGEWQSEITVKDSTEPDKAKAETQRTKAESVLGGRFVESLITNVTNNTSDYSLAWFDPAAKRYRQWFFNGTGGDFFEMTGTWDEAANTLTWTTPDGRLEWHSVMKSDDMREFRHVIKAADGKVLNEAAGMSRRTSSPAIAPFTDADVQRIAALPPVEQVEEVRKELRRCNPGFDGKVWQRPRAASSRNSGS
jgi:hypothetical protein